jgi:DNA invertase Pin-like site-specific DNA recombinase
VIPGRINKERYLGHSQVPGTVDELRHSLAQPTEPWIDSAGPFRDVIISLLASLAKQERVRIAERVRAGLTLVKQYGTRSGSIGGRERCSIEIGSLSFEGRDSLGARAKMIGVSPTTVRRACQGPLDVR